MAGSGAWRRYRQRDLPYGTGRKAEVLLPTVTDPAYRRRTEIVTIKQDGVIDEQNYIVAPNMRGQIVEA